MSLCKRDITKEIVHELQDIPLPQIGKLLQIRSGKVETLVNEPSGIFKKPVDGDRKSTRLNSSHSGESRMPSSA